MIRVLVAEDEEMIRKGLVYTTDWLGMDCVVVAEAADGQEGLEKILRYRPDVVIADICMPCIDGIEMIRRASQEARFKSILLTSYAEFEYARRAIEARVSEYLLKPVDEEKLAQVMRRLAAEIGESRRARTALEQAGSAAELKLEQYMALDTSENQYVARALEQIRARYRERLGIELISEELGVSASYLSRKFKEVTGQTFLDFLNRYRVRQAVRLLQTQRYRVSEISEAVGFTDYKHFCSVFKKYTMKSPTKFFKNV